MIRMVIKETAHYIPKRVVNNDDLTMYMDTSDEWIKTRTGIENRHIVTSENTSDLAIKVAQTLLIKSNVSAEQISFIIVATMSPDYTTPSVAAQVQGALQASNAFAFDVNAACSGFTYALSIANRMLSKPSQYGIVVGAEVLSKLVDWQDRTTAVLFGDGAGGVLIQGQAEGNQQVLAEDLVTLGEKSNSLKAGYRLNENIFSDKNDTQTGYFEMVGRDIYAFATREVPKSIKRALARANLTVNDIDKFVIHQANGRIIEKLAKELGLAKTLFPTNVAKYGNTSAASIPILLDELVQANEITIGDTIVMVGFGGGLTVGTMIIKY
ncbi:3-oxoacyl-[acyl-carrier-protein] synthase-3 [Weissella beninensis]|uniref:Beta-ketoacyl-[acyl-carrier-protein] synthase III n=1 Tax=Periweissella beninensis TaxID=504936 RepID=A0ABT0VFA2_9LACO|nr:beta-ketoacyl-ACP synthase III [Periweissella beninensis]MBM7543516.1 3-oxoacyl-[acyl-carrier-protein] synthase-3 [Periweissella beninensis]MCM2436498.1 ketoacyl-ACP synthase III [Periweissella beninensis]